MAKLNLWNPTRLWCNAHTALNIWSFTSTLIPKGNWWKTVRCVVGLGKSMSKEITTERIYRSMCRGLNKIAGHCRQGESCIEEIVAFVPTAKITTLLMRAKSVDCKCARSVSRIGKPAIWNFPNKLIYGSQVSFFDFSKRTKVFRF